MALQNRLTRIKTWLHNNAGDGFIIDTAFRIKESR